MSKRERILKSIVTNKRGNTVAKSTDVNFQVPELLNINVSRMDINPSQASSRVLQSSHR